jgi:putative salt-induced outer membrane protein YdiY
MTTSRRISYAALAVVALTIFSPDPAAAQAAAPQAPPPPPRQEGTAQLAFVGTTGNSSTTTLSAGGDHTFRPDKWILRNRALFVRSDAANPVTGVDTVTAESFLYLFRADRELTKRVSAFGSFGFLRDKPAGVSSHEDVNGGIAFKVIEAAAVQWTVDAGLGYMNENRLAGDDVHSATDSFGSLFKATLTDTTELTDELRFLQTFDDASDWRLGHIVSLTVKMSDIFSLKVSSQVRFANLPPPGFKKTDTTTAIALVAGFKKQ